MTVNYDITALVDGYRSGTSRTGIVRVAEFVAKELIKSDDLDIRFCTIENVFNIKDAIEFLNSRPDFKCVPFVYPSNYDFLLRITAFSARFYSLLGALGRQPLVSKIYKFIEYKSVNLLQKYFLQNINDKSPSLFANEVFHSTFYPFSFFNFYFNQDIKFITIYDLIPIMYPEFFKLESVSFFKDLYDSIDSDTWVLCISESTRRDLLKYKGDSVDPDKVFVIHLAASDHFYRSEDRLINSTVLRKYNIPSGPYVLALSILDPRKNMIQIIEAYIEVVRNYSISDLNLVLVGPNGNGAEKISRVIEEYPDFKGRIILAGFVEDEDLAAVYSEALMFVYPSIYEGFGLPILEAMQCGVPVITSNNSSMPEVAGNAAILIDPLNRPQLSNGMYELYSNPYLRHQMTELGIKRSRLFSWKRCAEQTVNAYKNAILSVRKVDNFL